MTRVIHFSLYDPTGFNLFKPERNARAETKVISCSLDNCPLLKKGQCQCLTFLQPNCPYSNVSGEVGPTKRANKFYSWISERRKKYDGVPWLKAPNKKMEFIGDYVYLPYHHMDQCKKIPFIRRHFLPKENWTIDNVVTLVEFLPEALFGGIIFSYQREEVPLFLAHLREQDPKMWQDLVERRPHLSKDPPNYIGRKAYLRTLNHPIEWTETSTDGKYPVSWKWDGKKLTTASQDAYSESWGKIKLESLKLTAIPVENAVVKVQSNDWVNEKTEFLD